MRIALFDAAPHWSGGAARVAMCARGGRDAGHDVTVVCLPTSRLRALAGRGVDVVTMRPCCDVDPFAALRIARLARERRWQVMDVHSPRFYWLCRYAARRTGAAFIITRNVRYRKRGIKRIINRHLYLACDRVVTVSDSVRRVLEEDFALSPGRAVTIHDGYDTTPIPEHDRQRHRVDVRRKYGFAMGDVVLAMVGRVDRNKAHDAAVAAVGRLHAAGVPVRLLAVGAVADRRFAAAVSRAAVRLGVGDRVVFTGFATEVRPFLCAADIIVSASRDEGISQSVVQGVLAGVPFVVTDVGGYREVLPAECGVYVPPGDAAALAGGVLQVLAARKRYADAVAQVDRGVFSPERMVREYLAVYAEVCERRGGA